MLLADEAGSDTGRVLPTGRMTLRGSDPQRFKATSRWHYINSQDGSCGFGAGARLSRTAIAWWARSRRSGRILGGPRAIRQSARRDALKFLVHLVGRRAPATACGQPRGFRWQPVPGQPAHRLWRPRTYARGSYTNGVMGTNLHAVWDYYVLASARLTRRQ